MIRWSPSIMRTTSQILTAIFRQPGLGGIVITLLWAGPIRAEQPLRISAPRVATMLEADGTLRELQGFGGLWAPGETIETQVADFACGGGRCAMNLGGELVLDSVRWQPPEDDAVLAIAPDGDGIAYLPEANRLARADRTRNEVQLSPGILGLSARDRVLTVRLGADPTALEAAVANEDSVRIVNQQGAVLNWLPDGTSAVLLLDQGSIVYARSGELVYETPASSPIRLQLDQVTTLRAAGDGFVQVTTADAAYILETRQPHAGRLTRLPTQVRTADPQAPKLRSRTRARGQQETSREDAQ